ncbi:hypothetical protein L204_102321 [Cryptococcus depauperatus]
MVSQLLKDHKVCLVEKQFWRKVIPLVHTTIEELGGSVISTQKEATIVLVNPNHYTYKHQLVQNTNGPLIRSYHWLAWCRKAERLVNPSEMELEAPVFTYPSDIEDNRPLRTYVSINLYRLLGEDSETAYADCVLVLSLGGALIVRKRADADLIVINEDSKFAKLAHKEKKEHGRDWQKIVDRNWVERCIKAKRLIWNENEDDDDGAESDDSFRSNGMTKNDTSERPPKKSRANYTARDDDFLCRWLAHHHPFGPFHSRKTYINLVAQVDEYPQASRHPYQSWHDRYKKNQRSFASRIARYVAEGIDRSLKTGKERRAAKKKETEIVQAECPDTNERPRLRLSKEESTTKGKRKLVVLSDNEDLPSAKRSTADLASNGTPEKDQLKASEETEGTDEFPQPINNIQTARNATVEDKGKTHVLIPPSSVLQSIQHSESSSPRQGPPAHSALTHNTSSKASALAALSDNTVSEQNQNRENQVLNVMSQNPDHNSNGHFLNQIEPDSSELYPQSIADTAIQEDAGQLKERNMMKVMRAKDSDTSVTSVDAEAVEDLMSEENKTFNNATENEAVSTIAEIGPNIPGNHDIEAESEQMDVLDVQQESLRIEVLPLPKNIRPATELIRIRQPVHADTTKQMVQVSSKGLQVVPINVSSTREMESSMAVVHSGFVNPKTRRSSVDVTGTSFESESTSEHLQSSKSAKKLNHRPRRSLLRDELLASSNKRRKTLDRISGASTSAAGPLANEEVDTVYASNAIPPRTPSLTPAPNIPMQETPPRTSQKPLSWRERNAKAERGRTLVNQLRQQYRAKIMELSQKYSLTPAQVVEWVNMTGRKDGGKYWDDVEKSLEAHFDKK